MLKSEKVQDPGNLTATINGGAQILLRCPVALKTRANQYAQGLGISLNALLAVALKDYLDARERSGESTPVSPAKGEELDLVGLVVSETRQQRRARERKEAKAIPVGE